MISNKLVQKKLETDQCSDKDDKIQQVDRSKLPVRGRTQCSEGCGNESWVQWTPISINSYVPVPAYKSISNVEVRDTVRIHLITSDECVDGSEANNDEP